VDPVLSILYRNIEQIQSNAWLLGIPSTSGPIPEKELLFCTTFDAQALNNWQTHNVHLGWIEPDTYRNQVILYLSKSKPETTMLIDLAVSYLSQSGGQLWIVGENSGGVKSVPAILEAKNLQGYKLDSARHCAIYTVEVAVTTDSSKPDIHQYFKKFRVEANVQLSSLPGVFSHQRLDQGTALLLNTLPDKISGPVLDFGCGCGVVGTHILKKHPGLEVDFLDISWLAVQSAKNTVAINAVKAREFYCQNGISSLANSYRLIVSNPPFHDGVRTNYSATEQFLDEAYSKLAIGGELIIVANQFLKYEPIIKQRFGSVTEVNRSEGFKILQAKRVR